MLETDQQKYVWDTFVDIKKGEFTYIWPKLAATLNCDRVHRRAVQNKFTPPIYALGYGHQRDFLSSNFEAVLKSNDSILDEFITCIENDLTRDYMLGLRQFPDEVPPECYVIKDAQFNASSTPSYSQQTEMHVCFLHKAPKKFSNLRILPFQLTRCIGMG